jgi:hypothetical protein
MGIAVIHWGIHYPHQQKIPKYCLTPSSGGCENGTTMVWQNSENNPSTKGATSGSIFY